MEIVALSLGGGLAAGAMQFYRAHRDADATADWILVANINILLRLDLDHLTGDDDNHGLREMCTTLEEASAKRPPSERKLLEAYNALIRQAIASGENVHDKAGNVDMRRVKSRRVHVQNALALGGRIEAALGGIAELANDAGPSRMDQIVNPRAPLAARG